jgi:hypothetical protein
METSDLLRHVAGLCERLGLRYFITGSIATIFFGEPRLTNDIDVVVDLPRERISDFASGFPAGEFYVSEEAIRRAVTRRSQFNVIHPASGLKVDVMIPAPIPFNESRFRRARRLSPGPDYEATFASPEDVILKKLEYYREGGSEKHLRDIAGILRVSRGRIDFTYLEEWADRQGLSDLWNEVRQTAEAE